MVLEPILLRLEIFSFWRKLVKIIILSYGYVYIYPRLLFRYLREVNIKLYKIYITLYFIK